MASSSATAVVPFAGAAAGTSAAASSVDVQSYVEARQYEHLRGLDVSFYDCFGQLRLAAGQDPAQPNLLADTYGPYLAFRKGLLRRRLVHEHLQRHGIDPTAPLPTALTGHGSAAAAAAATAAAAAASRGPLPSALGFAAEAGSGSKALADALAASFAQKLAAAATADTDSSAADTAPRSTPEAGGAVIQSRYTRGNRFLLGTPMAQSLAADAVAPAFGMPVTDLAASAGAAGDGSAGLGYGEWRKALLHRRFEQRRALLDGELMKRLAAEALGRALAAETAERTAAAGAPLAGSRAIPPGASSSSAAAGGGGVRSSTAAAISASAAPDPLIWRVQHSIDLTPPSRSAAATASSQGRRRKSISTESGAAISGSLGLGGFGEATAIGFAPSLSQQQQQELVQQQTAQWQRQQQRQHASDGASTAGATAAGAGAGTTGSSTEYIDPQVFAVGTTSGSIILCSATTGKKWALLEGHTGAVTAFDWAVPTLGTASAFDPTVVVCCRLISVSADQTARVWEVQLPAVIKVERPSTVPESSPQQQQQQQQQGGNTGTRSRSAGPRPKANSSAGGEGSASVRPSRRRSVASMAAVDTRERTKALRELRQLQQEALHSDRERRLRQPLLVAQGGSAECSGVVQASYPLTHVAVCPLNPSLFVACGVKGNSGRVDPFPVFNTPQQAQWHPGMDADADAAAGTAANGAGAGASGNAGMAGMKAVGGLLKAGLRGGMHAMKAMGDATLGALESVPVVGGAVGKTVGLTMGLTVGVPLALLKGAADAVKSGVANTVGAGSGTAESDRKGYIFVASAETYRMLQERKVQGSRQAAMAAMGAMGMGGPNGAAAAGSGAAATSGMHSSGMNMAMDMGNAARAIQRPVSYATAMCFARNGHQLFIADASGLVHLYLVEADLAKQATRPLREHMVVFGESNTRPEGPTVTGMQQQPGAASSVGGNTAAPGGKAAYFVSLSHRPFDSALRCPLLIGLDCNKRIRALSLPPVTTAGTNKTFTGEHSFGGIGGGSGGHGAQRLLQGIQEVGAATIGGAQHALSVLRHAGQTGSGSGSGGSGAGSGTTSRVAVGAMDSVTGDVHIPTAIRANEVKPFIRYVSGARLSKQAYLLEEVMTDVAMTALNEAEASGMSRTQVAHALGPLRSAVDSATAAVSVGTGGQRPGMRSALGPHTTVFASRRHDGVVAGTDTGDIFLLTPHAKDTPKKAGQPTPSADLAKGAGVVPVQVMAKLLHADTESLAASAPPSASMAISGSSGASGGAADLAGISSLRAGETRAFSDRKGGETSINKPRKTAHERGIRLLSLNRDENIVVSVDETGALLIWERLPLSRADPSAHAAHLRRLQELQAEEAQRSDLEAAVLSAASTASTVQLRVPVKQMSLAGAPVTPRK